MQLNFNTNSASNQNFGMALKMDKEGKVAHLLKQQLKQQDWNKLDKIIESQKNNPVTAELGVMRDGTLCGAVYDYKNFCDHYQQGIFGNLFSSPIKFIEKLCKKADSRKAEFYNDNNNSILNKMA